jgi:hypothetical protein
VLFTDTITLTDVVADGETAETADYRTDTYTFNNIPDDGSTYRIFVQALNFTEVFQNEPSSFGSNKLEHSTYTADAYTVVDYNGDDKAEVNVYMTFNPAEFDLYFTVDATAIGEGFRPSNAGVVVLYNDRLPHEEQREPQQWPIISQQKQGNVVTPHSFEMMADGSTKGEVIGGTETIWHKEPVWRTHPTGDYYGYAVKLWQTTIGGTVYNQTNCLWM